MKLSNLIPVLTWRLRLLTLTWHGRNMAKMLELARRRSDFETVEYLRPRIISNDLTRARLLGKIVRAE